MPLPQRAIAFGLDQEQQFYCGLGAMLHQKRQLLEGQLAGMGFRVLPAEVNCRLCSAAAAAAAAAANCTIPSFLYHHLSLPIGRPFNADPESGICHMPPPGCQWLPNSSCCAAL